MMKMPSTLSRYLARIYTFNLLFMTAVLWGVIYLFDTVELLRRAGKQDDVPLSLVLKMGLLKLPDVGLTVFPFAILFAAMFTFWQLTKRHELVVVRAAGFSVWQFLTPITGVAVAAGIIIVTMVNPLGSLLLGKYAALEDTYLNEKQSYVALFDEGLWLRQTQDDTYVILHAGGVKMPEWKLNNVMALFFDKDNNFRRRIDATEAMLDNERGQWLFKDSFDNRAGTRAEHVALIALPTTLTTGEIEESFASPNTMSFWTLPAFIRVMEQTGFDATRLRIHFQSLLAQPFLFAAMILLAAAVAMRPQRQKNTFGLIAGGIFIGFMTFFMASFLQALGASHQIPVLLASWSPALVLLLLGIAAMLNLEDG